MNEILESLKKPGIMNFKNALFIGPHPDDIEIGASGAMLEMIKHGCKAHLLIVTDGGSGTSDPLMMSEHLALIRHNEASNAAKYLEVESLTFLDYPDGGMYNRDEVRRDIAKAIINIKPDIIFAPDPHLLTETHPDHINVGNASKEALVIAGYRNSAIRNGIDVEEIEEFPRNITIAYYYTDRPNLVVPISSENYEKKMEALFFHQSQIDEGMKTMLEYLNYKAKELGKTVNSEYAEQYFVQHPLTQHCFNEKM